MSTVVDYAKFGRMLIRGGVCENGQRLLSDKTLQYMMRNHLPDGSTLHDHAPNWVRGWMGVGVGGPVAVVMW